MSLPSPRSRGYRLIVAPTVALTVLALAAAGCGGGKKSSGGGGTTSRPSGASAPKAAGSTLAETASDFKFSQPKPTVKSGTVNVELRNGGGTAHGFEIEGPKGEIRTKVVQPGQSAAVSAKLAPGKYEFYCPVDGHKKLGMKGTLTVK
jgi:plastocyanin